jgi:predicted SAM-dependent methyltransferase
LGQGEFHTQAGWQQIKIRWILWIENFLRYWKPNSLDVLVAEHVWEHLTEEEAVQANANCYEFLRPGGRLRIAVPGGFHPDPAYIEYVRPGGMGLGADDHKVLYSCQSLKAQLEKAGFIVSLLEYWDEHGSFHFKEWSSEDGHILRSKRYDSWNQDGSLTYTSLIVDAIKPLLHISRFLRGCRFFLKFRFSVEWIVCF